MKPECQYPDCPNMQHPKLKLEADVRPVRNTGTGQVVYLCKDHRYSNITYASPPYRKD